MIWTFGLVIAARVGVLHITLTYVASFLVLNALRAPRARPAALARDRADHRADVSAVRVLHDHRSAHGRGGRDSRSSCGDHRGRGDADPRLRPTGLAAADRVQRGARAARAARSSARGEVASTFAGLAGDAALHTT